MIKSPFSALNASNSGLADLPPSLEPLRARMADLYGVDVAELTVSRGASHGLEILFRRLRVHGFEYITAKTDAYLEDLASVYNLEIKSTTDKAIIRKGGLYLIDNPNQPDGKAWDLITARTLAVEIYPTLLVIDESYCDTCSSLSLTDLAKSETNVVILKSLSYLYGLSGARIGAIISNPKTLQALLRYCEPHPLPTPSIKAAELALSPSRSLAVEARIELIKFEQKRLNDALKNNDLLDGFELNDGPFIHLFPKATAQTKADLKKLGLQPQPTEKGLWLGIGDKSYNDRLLLALGVKDDFKPLRTAQVIRDTKETRICALVDLDNNGPIAIQTGIGFFDHMLEQVATHAGFSLRLSVEGDLHIDDHHSVEDAMLTFGEALKQALGDRIGMARFGFVLPMDETQAKLSIDLGGRPFCVFKGDFKDARIGAYQTQMTSHAFRSLSESLGASIHVEVEGDNDHHKVEACFKALGRALRQAIKIEGDALPTTKGVLA